MHVALRRKRGLPTVLYAVLFILSWGYSSVGRAPALQAGGHEFDSHYLHCDPLKDHDRTLKNEYYN